MKIFVLFSLVAILYILFILILNYYLIFKKLNFLTGFWSFSITLVVHIYLFISLLTSHINLPIIKTTKIIINKNLIFDIFPVAELSGGGLQKSVEHTVHLQ
ncbi:hypothetical protein Mgra_00006931 [Meloidogyne graminicola]|uniref:Uncharacterized protein n=1 Tax=Meloidogyne graminicola TaxID=189291 RepID=A0A8S9ZKF1_9BILA|nr:hypothetical protein Mgra_00006931 [Meloidogyne graminicola]